ncbi:MAG: hypothetical protein GF329_16720 [Candidatus Lokiarchaeota archaeon]|nr:hypothetical protein [Candidatus Lokiarchaeota archaeon]
MIKIKKLKAKTINKFLLVAFCAIFIINIYILANQIDNCGLNSNVKMGTRITFSPKEVNDPENLSLQETSIGVIEWKITDGDSTDGQYRVYVDGVAGGWANWTDGVNLSHPVDTSTVGLYNYTIEYRDNIPNYGDPHTVWVEITPEPTPPQINWVLNKELEQGSSGTIEWIITDNLGAGYYRVFVNETPSNWLQWVNNTNIAYPIDTSTLGIYNYTIQYNDSSGNMGTSDTVFITIIPESTIPIPSFLVIFVIIGLVIVPLLLKRKPKDFF